MIHDFQIGEVIEAEVWDNEWREGTIISKKVRANGQTYFQVVVRRISHTPYLTAKRIRRLNGERFDARSA
jgi:hypothetical protein